MASQNLRNNNFDLLRLFFASLVILAHAPELTYGGLAHEPLSQLTHTQYNLGSLAVSGFFLLSGFLIVQSWLRDPHLGSYLRKRLLRIVPGYLVAALVSTLVLGSLAPAVDHYFQRLNHHYVTSLLLLGTLSAPPVFPGVPFHTIDESLWTIPYEMRCYLVVSALGLMGILRYRTVVATLAAVLVAVMAFPPILHDIAWHKVFFVTGEPWDTCRLLATFLTGACFHLFRDRIPFRPALAVAAALLLAAVLFFLPWMFEPAVIVFGSYLLFYVGRTTFSFLAWTSKMPDISYGVYLYGMPIECLWIWYRRGSPWVTFVAGLLLAMIAGWLSWHFVERPMLRLKRNPSVPLPAS